VPNSEARQQKGNEGDATLDLVLKHKMQQMQHPDLLLKYLDATVVIYKRRQMKHLKQASEKLAKTSKNL
jgi:hypothetical protein